jgi:N utilization substance protein B
MITKDAAEGTARKPRGKSGRRRSREFALQGLYQWQLSGASATAIEKQLAETSGFDKADEDYFRELLHGAIEDVAGLDTLLLPHLDRKIEELSPIERGILLLGAYELKHRPEVPYRVVINEAIELAKTFGGTDGHKYVNGVLDKVAPEVRAAEVTGKSS